MTSWCVSCCAALLANNQRKTRRSFVVCKNAGLMSDDVTVFVPFIICVCDMFNTVRLQSFASEMNSLVALHELYKYINKYYDQVTEICVCCLCFSFALLASGFCWYRNSENMISSWFFHTFSHKDLTIHLNYDMIRFIMDVSWI